jgi:hypothetical protein
MSSWETRYVQVAMAPSAPDAASVAGKHGHAPARECRARAPTGDPGPRRSGQRRDGFVELLGRSARHDQHRALGARTTFALVLPATMRRRGPKAARSDDEEVELRAPGDQLAGGVSLEGDAFDAQPGAGGGRGPLQHARREFAERVREAGVAEAAGVERPDGLVRLDDREETQRRPGAARDVRSQSRDTLGLAGAVGGGPDQPERRLAARAP